MSTCVMCSVCSVKPATHLVNNQWLCEEHATQSQEYERRTTFPMKELITHDDVVKLVLDLEKEHSIKIISRSALDGVEHPVVSLYEVVRSLAQSINKKISEIWAAEKLKEHLASVKIQPVSVAAKIEYGGPEKRIVDFARTLEAEECISIELQNKLIKMFAAKIIEYSFSVSMNTIKKPEAKR